MRSKTLLLTLCICFGAGGNSLLAATEFSPDVVLANVAKKGAAAAVKDYYDKPVWLAILSGIASGEERWLSVYKALRTASDAGAGEDLGYALFEAMPVAPFRVIPLLFIQGSSVEALCTMSFEADVPAEGVNAYLTKLEMSLRGAKTGAERKMALECVKGIAVTRETFRGSSIY